MDCRDLYCFLLYNRINMKNNISDLESRDNWLEKERQRESRISAWDLDEGKRIREEHEDNCEVKETAALHERRHQRRTKIDYEATGGNERPQNAPSSWFFIDLILLFVVIFIRIVMPYNLPVHFAGAIVLFLGINPGIFLWLFLGKRFPPKGYWKFLFLLTIFIELVAALMFHPQVYYY